MHPEEAFRATVLKGFDDCVLRSLKRGDITPRTPSGRGGMSRSVTCNGGGMSVPI